MDDVFLGEIRAVGFNYAPRGWALCDGSLQQIRSNTALFSLLGTFYGGDGRTTFALPDLRGRAVVHLGQGTGLSSYTLGQASGTENVTLLPANLPAHIHTAATAGRVAASTTGGGQLSPANSFLADSGSIPEYGEEADATLMAANMISGISGAAGGNTPHSNMMPYLTTNYIIAIQGQFPIRP